MIAKPRGVDSNAAATFGIFAIGSLEALGIHGDIGYQRNFSNFTPFAYDRALFSFYLMARY